MARDLFNPTLQLDQTHPLFQRVYQGPGHLAARELMNALFAEFTDVDGSFVREFQTGGFSARTFELALFAYLQERDLDLDRSHPAPDFYVRGKLPVAIEVTTTNPTQTAGAHTEADNNDAAAAALVPPDLPEADRAFIFQLGKALRRKLLHRNAQDQAYWQQPHVAGVPFVIAVGAFHDRYAHWHPVGLVSQYLYGARDTFEHDEGGILTISTESIVQHRHAGRTIPSGLFACPEAKHLSAVLFSNSHTMAIFNRIGVEQGLGSTESALCRMGTCYDPDPSASTPQAFAYVVGDRPPAEHETFADGLHLLINPHANDPLLPNALPGITHHLQQPDGKVMPHLYDGLHVHVSQTMIFQGANAATFARYQRLLYLGLLHGRQDL